MSDHYYFPGQFKCMYCKIDLDDELPIALRSDDGINLPCLACGATWRFFVQVSLQHKLVRGGKFNNRQARDKVVE